MTTIETITPSLAMIHAHPAFVAVAASDPDALFGIMRPRYYVFYGADASTVAAVCSAQVFDESADWFAAGFPISGFEQYVAKLISAGHRVKLATAIGDKLIVREYAFTAY
jgi:DNA mismatch repair ATPase MutS